MSCLNLPSPKQIGEGGSKRVGLFQRVVLRCHPPDRMSLESYGAHGLAFAAQAWAWGVGVQQKTRECI